MQLDDMVRELWVLLLERARFEIRPDGEAVIQVNLQETPEGSRVQLECLPISFPSLMHPKRVPRLRCDPSADTSEPSRKRRCQLQRHSCRLELREVLVQNGGCEQSFLCIGFLLVVAAGDSDLQAVGS